MRRRAAAAALLLAVAGGAGAFDTRNILYFYGYVKHGEPTPDTNEGNLKYLGYGREFPFDKWRVVAGLATYVDSYRVRSYSAFTDISHTDFAWGIVRPMLSLQCQSKGSNYVTDDRRTLCFPLPKLRFGADNGLFVSVSGTPRLGELTNGFVVAEFGYQW